VSLVRRRLSARKVGSESGERPKVNRTPDQRTGRCRPGGQIGVSLRGKNVGHILNMKEQPTMFMKTKDEKNKCGNNPRCLSKQMTYFGYPTMCMKKQDLSSL